MKNFFNIDKYDVKENRILVFIKRDFFFYLNCKNIKNEIKGVGFVVW